MLVATPSGVTLGPEGGAHQSINPPLIALGQPGLRHYEPAFVDELALLMEEGFRLMQRAGRRERLSAPHHPHDPQVERADDGWKAGALAGGYWLREPAPGAEAALVYSGAIAPEALAAWEALKDDVPGLGLLAVTSPDLLHRGWSARRSGRWKGRGTGAT
jgi:pyruvate dehydrogenase E1 component